MANTAHTVARSPSIADLPEPVKVSALLRFWRRIGSGERCRLWPGERRSNGYGLYELNVEGKRVRFRAHRFAYEAVNGPIPDGKYVLHRCDVRQCRRPDHLFLGTKRENSHDMMAKGRWSKAHPPKLSPTQVRAVRERFAAGAGATTVGKEFNIRRDLAEDIRRGEAYAWVE